ncbi:ACT domain-containing protein [Paludibacterium paludis]|uniref:Uncharacterized protein n=1 Tax=Paludibacterium paludis TaxID=1225769 RepID=A0A918P5D3_9NEIS|nr:ACT domain-containing protein [Paludibacterium paludis]GGY22419.1 hypothetical protein GCM10011289_27730 [Paludibacterium paludis]
MTVTANIYLDPRRYAICLVDESSYYDLPLVPLCVLGQKGPLLSVVAEKREAEASGLTHRADWACIKVETRAGGSRMSSLTACLNAAKLPCRMIAGYGHERCLVLWQHRYEALAILRAFFGRKPTRRPYASAA